MPLYTQNMTSKPPVKKMADDMLKVLIATVKNKDPSKPLEQDKLISMYLAYASAINSDDQTKTLSDIKNSLEQGNFLAACDLIGKEIFYKTEKFHNTPGADNVLKTEAPCNISIKDSNGRIVEEHANIKELMFTHNQKGDFFIQSDKEWFLKGHVDDVHNAGNGIEIISGANNLSLMALRSYTKA